MTTEKLAAGVYVTDDGALHLDLAEILEHAGFPDTPENRQMMTDAAHDIVRQRWPDVRIEDV